MKTIFIKPVGKARVLNPDQCPPRPLPEKGLKVLDSQYWRRRLAEGVVELAAADQPAEPPEPTAKPAGKKNKEVGE